MSRCIHRMLHLECFDQPWKSWKLIIIVPGGGILLQMRRTGHVSACLSLCLSAFYGTDLYLTSASLVAKDLLSILSLDQSFYSGTREARRLPIRQGISPVNPLQGPSRPPRGTTEWPTRLVVQVLHLLWVWSEHTCIESRPTTSLRPAVCSDTQRTEIGSPVLQLL
jgi:hypothetical protein